MKLYNNLLLSDASIERIKIKYGDKLELVTSDIRHHKSYHETNPSTWIYKLINDLVKKNMGDNYSIYTRVTILKYTPGDYFMNHVDGSHNTKLDPNLLEHFYGGIELNNQDDFTGGKFFINGNDVPFLKGRLITHEFDEPHGVSEVINGDRWSIHFPIKMNYKISLI